MSSARGWSREVSGRARQLLRKKCLAGVRIEAKQQPVANVQIPQHSASQDWRTGTRRPGVATSDGAYRKSGCPARLDVHRFEGRRAGNEYSTGCHIRTPGDRLLASVADLALEKLTTNMA